MDGAAQWRDVQVIDSDTHVSEPADLWTSRLPGKYRDVAPRVERHPDDGTLRWLLPGIGVWLSGVGYYARSLWDEQDSGQGRDASYPMSYEEMDPGTWRSDARLKQMDAYGIYAQVLYPNLIAFETMHFLNHDDPEFALACTRAYNDFLTDFAAADPNRLLPITMIPFWDLDAAVAEIRRGKEAGHRGILVGNRYENIGLPGFTEPYWDPMYAVAEELGMSINFHIAFTLDRSGQNTAAQAAVRNNPREHTRLASMTALGNAEPIGRVLTSGLCDRFPTLGFVSVESGFGYVPYLLDALDFYWKVNQIDRLEPDATLPSEAFARQCYGSFWFETATLPMLEQFPDNMMFESDYPHPTSLATGSQQPLDHIADAFDGVVSAEVARKVLHDNAAKLYHVA